MRAGVPLVRRLLRHDRVRFALTAGGVGLTVALMLLLFSLYEGVRREANGYVATRAADAWVCHRNSTNLVRSSSYMVANVADELRRTPGVARVSPVLRVIASTRIGGRSATFFILGIDPAEPATAPRTVAGSALPGPGELVLDRAFAAKHGLRPGDTLRVQDRTFRVAGLSTGTNAVITQFGFATLADAQQLLGFQGIVSFWLVEGAPGTDPARLVEALRAAHPRLNVFSAGDFARNNLEELRTGLLPLVASVAVFGTLVGAALLTLLLYGSVRERRTDYALLEAIGAGHGFVEAIVLRQAAAAAVAGLLAGALVAAAAGPLIRLFAPEVVFAVRPWIALTVTGLTGALGLLAAWLPVRGLRRIYPAEAFRP
jgi:putative ABC transport system permease protein